MVFQLWNLTSFLWLVVVFLVQVDWVVGWKISEREFGFLVKAESMGEESVVSSPYQVLELKQSIRQPAWAGEHREIHHNLCGLNQQPHRLISNLTELKM